VMAPPGISDEEYKAVEAATPLGRWGGDEEVVRAVIFLIESEFVTGETLRVDGGRHLR
jgi:NAD(P)-dependent dehydrogenase (short-subunit alcohol dehydrogenase family)